MIWQTYPSMRSLLLWMLRASRRYGYITTQSNILELNACVISNYGTRDQTDHTMKRSGAIPFRPAVIVSISSLTRTTG